MRNYFCLYVPLLVETQLFLAPATDVLYLPCCRWCKIFATFVEYFPSQQFFPPADILIRSQGIIIFWASKMLYCLSHKVLNLFYYNLLDSHRGWIEIFSCTWHSGAKIMTLLNGMRHWATQPRTPLCLSLPGASRPTTLATLSCQ